MNTNQRLIRKMASMCLYLTCGVTGGSRTSCFVMLTFIIANQLILPGEAEEKITCNLCSYEFQTYKGPDNPYPCMPNYEGSPSGNMPCTSEQDGCFRVSIRRGHPTWTNGFGGCTNVAKKTKCVEDVTGAKFDTDTGCTPTIVELSQELEFKLKSDCNLVQVQMNHNKNTINYTLPPPCEDGVDRCLIGKKLKRDIGPPVEEKANYTICVCNGDQCNNNRGVLGPIGAYDSENDSAKDSANENGTGIELPLFGSWWGMGGMVGAIFYMSTKRT